MPKGKKTTLNKTLVIAFDSNNVLHMEKTIN